MFCERVLTCFVKASWRSCRFGVLFEYVLCVFVNASWRAMRRRLGGLGNLLFGKASCQVL